MSEPLLTVVIPAYNAARTLVRAVLSVQAQDFPCHILVVDDGSRDDTRAVAAGLAAEVPWLRYFHQDNAGAAAARNTGIRHATTRYLCFLDADDTYAPEYFRTVVPYLEAHPEVDAVMTGMAFVNLNRPVHPLQYERVLSSSPTNTLVRRVAADLVGGFPLGQAFRGRAGAEDTQFKRALVDRFTVVQIPHKFYVYHVEPNNHMHYFLDRSRIQDNALVFTEESPEEADGSIASAAREFLAQVDDRLEAAFACKGNALRRLSLALDAVEALAAPTVDPAAVMATLARFGPSQGPTVVLGPGNEALAQAAARASAAREPVVTASGDVDTLVRLGEGWEDMARLLVLPPWGWPADHSALLAAWGPRLKGLGLLVCQTDTTAGALVGSGQWQTVRRAGTFILLRRV